MAADRAHIPDEAEVRARWSGWRWSDANAQQAQRVIERYPPGRQASAVMPLLDLAQRQVGEETGTQGWLPIPVMEAIAQQLDMPKIRVLEVATFYTMYNLRPVGRYHVQVCGTTPCMLRGSDDVLRACYDRGMKKDATTDDGLFTLIEVECLGSCASAPMVQINDDNFEDLDYDRTLTVLDALARGERPKPGTQEPGRHTVEPLGAPTNLAAMIDENHDYRGEWRA
ncbi:NADH-quinone oxidoreductase subunit E [Sphingomonas jejuensis]|uniref:NADH-quinone oxidoreductase subunit E n=1 Tax=Sphingomonas jejuensis TaxID=904715 RepID=A0ABX0XIW5_9SPHN|nr:NAD(P)H-dependent oxidoreductase subunit E [Sphingomonas jejuensis]NJC33180.1 NADH-quinone oxidoreductase subunit E [Sphingomonas jejuensis]